MKKQSFHFLNKNLKKIYKSLLGLEWGKTYPQSFSQSLQTTIFKRPAVSVLVEKAILPIGITNLKESFKPFKLNCLRGFFFLRMAQKAGLEWG